jgi:hypothetical protein
VEVRRRFHTRNRLRADHAGTQHARRGGAKGEQRPRNAIPNPKKKSPVAILNSYMRWFATAHFSSACAFRVHVPKFLPPTRVPVSPCIHYPDTKRPRSQCVIMLPSPLAGSPRFFLSFVFRFLCSVFHRLRQVLFVCCRQRLQGAAVG